MVYNRLDAEPEEKLLPACRSLGLGVLARVPLASGFLSGKYRPGARFPAGDVRASQDLAKAEERLKRVEAIRRDEVPPGADMAQWALAWCLRNPTVTAVIPGCKDVAQVEHNAAAAAAAAAAGAAG